MDNLDDYEVEIEFEGNSNNETDEESIKNDSEEESLNANEYSKKFQNIYNKLKKLNLISETKNSTRVLKE